MAIRERVLKVVGFRVLPTTVLVSFVYLLLFISTLLSDEPRAPSSSTISKTDIDFANAWSDLQVVRSSFARDLSQFADICPDIDAPASIEFASERCGRTAHPQ